MGICHKLLYSSIPIFIVFFILVFISKSFIYDDQKSHRVKSTCMVEDCVVFSAECSRERCTGTSSSRKCRTTYYTCWERTLYFNLKWNGDTYYTDSKQKSDSRSTAENFCHNHKINSTMNCWFDSRRPQSSLSIYSSGPLAGGIAAITIFTIITFAALVLLLISSITLIRRNWSTFELPDLPDLPDLREVAIFHSEEKPEEKVIDYSKIEISSPVPHDTDHIKNHNNNNHNINKITSIEETTVTTTTTTNSVDSKEEVDKLKEQVHQLQLQLEEAKKHDS